MADNFRGPRCEGELPIPNALWYEHPCDCDCDEYLGGFVLAGHVSRLLAVLLIARQRRHEQKGSRGLRVTNIEHVWSELDGDGFLPFYGGAFEPFEPEMRHVPGLSPITHATIEFYRRPTSGSIRWRDRLLPPPVPGL